MSPAQPCALCWLACTKIALLQCSRQLDIKELTIKNIICHLPVRLWGDQRKPLNAVSRIILVPYEVPVSRIILYNCCYSFRTVECWMCGDVKSMRFKCVWHDWLAAVHCVHCAVMSQSCFRLSFTSCSRLLAAVLEHGLIHSMQQFYLWFIMDLESCLHQTLGLARPQEAEGKVSRSGAGVGHGTEEWRGKGCIWYYRGRG